MNAAGDLFYTDNQGPWNGTCSLKHLIPGKFVGHPGGHKWYELPEVKAALEEHPEGARLPILPISLRLGGKTLSFITTLTTFGSVQDALAQGVLIESFFPADDETKAHFEGA